MQDHIILVHIIVAKVGGHKLKEGKKIVEQFIVHIGTNVSYNTINQTHVLVLFARNSKVTKHFTFLEINPML